MRGVWPIEQVNIPPANKLDSMTMMQLGLPSAAMEATCGAGEAQA